MNSALQRATAIKLSLRVWRLGWLSLLPFLGIGPILVNIVTLLHIHTLNHDWNPARYRLFSGIALSLLGGLISISIVVALIIKHYEEFYDFISPYLPA
ncbi:MAG: hypothetical protein JWN25_986 [Verrucomicrobiales bacterium]|jgi:hypothetical protein|nr:hypothetical protein [Verrucomicrobiales bacterium]MDB6130166.1 hypothetical protein [Verrucomicrobiales bacterium]